MSRRRKYVESFVEVVGGKRRVVIKKAPKPSIALHNPHPSKRPALARKQTLSEAPHTSTPPVDDVPDFMDTAFDNLPEDMVHEVTDKNKSKPGKVGCF